MYTSDAEAEALCEHQKHVVLVGWVFLKLRYNDTREQMLKYRTDGYQKFFTELVKRNKWD